LTERYECAAAGDVMRAMLAASPVDAEFSTREHFDYGAFGELWLQFR
jgi:hypothetical protein